MAYRLSIKLLGLPTSERNARRHWAVENEENRAWKRAVAFAVGGRLPDRPLARARVVLTRHSSVPMDPENMHESFKPIVDAIRIGRTRRGRGLPILTDDAAENFVGGQPEYRWEPAPPRKGFVTITVEEPDGQEDRSTPDHSRGPEDRQDGIADR